MAENDWKFCPICLEEDGILIEMDHIEDDYICPKCKNWDDDEEK